MNNLELIDAAGAFVTQYIKGHNNKNLLYHNLEHTKSGVAAASQIANHYQLAERDLTAVMIASWFHDVGYYNGPATAHEERGTPLAEQIRITGSHPRLMQDSIWTMASCSVRQ